MEYELAAVHSLVLDATGLCATKIFVVTEHWFIYPVYLNRKSVRIALNDINKESITCAHFCGEHTWNFECTCQKRINCFLRPNDCVHLWRTKNYNKFHFSEANKKFQSTHTHAHNGKMQQSHADYIDGREINWKKRAAKRNEPKWLAKHFVNDVQRHAA